MKIAIVGGGLGGLWCAYELSKVSSFNIDFFLGDFNRGATKNSTGVISNFGIKKGISPLGDLLFDSHKHAFSKYINEFNYISKDHILFSSINNKNFQSRFSNFRFSQVESLIWFKDECLLIDGSDFRKTVLDRIDKNSNVKIKNNFFNYEEELNLHYEYIILCQGFHKYSTESLVRESKAKPRMGHYLYWELEGIPHPEDLGHQMKVDPHSSFHLDNFGKWYLSFRFKSNENFSNSIILGTVNENESAYIGDIANLRGIYTDALKFLKLPPLENAKIKSGLRELNNDRMPKLSEIKEGLWSLTGLHKNGWTLAPYFADKLKKHLSFKTNL